METEPFGSYAGGYLGFSNFGRQSICKRKNSASYTETGILDYGTDKGILPQNTDGKYHAMILDPFCGSGTLGVCCEKLNRQGHNIRWVGIELEKRWCDIADQRIRGLEG